MTTRHLYFNHAGTSWPKPQVVVEAVHEAMSLPPTRWAHQFDEAHQAIAEFFGVSQPEQILLTPGCTSALAVGIGDALIPDGKRVLTSRWEHHALHRPLLKLASTGVRVEYIPPKGTGTKEGAVSLIDLDWLERALSEQDVALVALTAACNVTGEVLPYEEVIQMAHQFGAMVLIDAAQIVGWLSLDLPALGADMVAFGGHKGLQGPWGIGGLYLGERAQMECLSASCELPTAADAAGIHPPRPGYCDVGSVDQFALAGLHAAIQLLGEQNLTANLTRARKQIQCFRKTLEQIERVRIYGAGEDGLPTLACAISGISSSEAATHFRRQGLVVGSGTQCAPLAHETLGTQDVGLLRFSVGVGQPDADIDEAIDRIRSALP